MSPQPKDAPRGRSPLRAFRTIFWSFLGIRRRADTQQDLAGVTPLQIIIAGVIGAVLFVTTLVVLVKLIVR